MGTRIITGIIGIALAAFIIQTGGMLFNGTVLVLSIIGWHEFARAFAHKGQNLAYLTGILALLLLWGCAVFGVPEETMMVTTGIVLIVMAEAVFLHSSFSVEEAMISAAGILYTGILFSYLPMLRAWGDGAVISSPAGNMELGCAFIWVALIGTWASDTFAYFSGSLCGRHKLCPSISPGKTVEGLIGGIIGTVLSVTGLGVFFGFTLWEMALLGLCLALIATLGDLVESIIKRHTGIKDSGSLIPGHGGVLDRFDSTLFTMPFMYYFIQICKLAG